MTDERLADAYTIVGERRRLSAERGAELLSHIDALEAELAEARRDALAGGQLLLKYDCYNEDLEAENKRLREALEVARTNADTIIRVQKAYGADYTYAQNTIDTIEALEANDD